MFGRFLRKQFVIAANHITDMRPGSIKWPPILILRTLFLVSFKTSYIFVFIHTHDTDRNFQPVSLKCLVSFFKACSSKCNVSHSIQKPLRPFFGRCSIDLSCYDQIKQIKWIFECIGLAYHVKFIKYNISMKEAKASGFEMDC